MKSTKNKSSFSCLNFFWMSLKHGLNLEACYYKLLIFMPLHASLKLGVLLCFYLVESTKDYDDSAIILSQDMQ